ncbi:MAG: TraC family protein, partial [Alphaproteobacteria bacterium]|nr:TraC family protein [Alphaproteobacteria bacterium]
MMIERLSKIGHKLALYLKEPTDFGVGDLSPSIRMMRTYLEQFPLSSLLPYRSYENGIFYNEESAGFVLETHPMVGCTEEMQRELSGLFQHTLPEGSNI